MGHLLCYGRHTPVALSAQFYTSYTEFNWGNIGINLNLVSFCNTEDCKGLWVRPSWSATTSLSHMQHTMFTDEQTRVGVTKPISSVRLFSYFFSIVKHMLTIKLHLYIWQASPAMVAPVKCKCDSNNLRDTLTRSKILLTEKLTNGALVTPTSAKLLLTMFSCNTTVLVPEVV